MLSDSMYNEKKTIFSVEELVFYGERGRKEFS